MPKAAAGADAADPDTGIDDNCHKGCQAVEEHRGEGQGGAAICALYIRYLRYIDSPVRRDPDESGEYALNEQVSCAVDANMNVMMLAGNLGFEGYRCNPCGRIEVHYCEGNPDPGEGRRR